MLYSSCGYSMFVVLYIAPPTPPDLSLFGLAGPYSVVVGIFVPDLPPESGEFIGFNISYNSSSTQMSLLTPNTSIVLTDLQPYTLYTFRVATVSTGGQGPWSPTYTVFTESGGECFDGLTCMSSVFVGELQVLYSVSDRQISAFEEW